MLKLMYANISSCENGMKTHSNEMPNRRTLTPTSEVERHDSVKVVMKS